MGWKMRQKRLWGCWRGRNLAKSRIRLADDAQKKKWRHYVAIKCANFKIAALLYIHHSDRGG